MMLVDSHCHLDFPDFDPEREAVIARAEQASVKAMLTISTSLKTFPRVRAIAERYPNIWCSVGIHPHEADQEEADARTLIELAQHPKVIGIGETGLDYYYDHSDRSAQAASFRSHIRAAQETGLPIIVHTRDADHDTAQILTEAMAEKPFRGLLHCFTSSQALAEKAVAMGMMVSFSGILTFKKTDDLRATAAALPLDHILVETDAPYLAPAPHRGKRNEPAFTAHTAALLAALRGIDLETLARATTDNFFRLFTKAERAALGA